MLQTLFFKVAEQASLCLHCHANYNLSIVFNAYLSTPPKLQTLLPQKQKWKNLWILTLRY